jgi:hypothetical protein
MEMLRRSILGAALLIGLWLCFWNTPYLFRVDPVNWDHYRQQKIDSGAELKKMASDTLGFDVSPDVDVYAETRLDREAFIAHETQGRRVRVEGAGWEAFFIGVSETVLGRPPSPSWNRRQARRPASGSLYFRTNETPLSAIAAGFRDPNVHQFVQIQGLTRTEYLSVYLEKQNVFSRHAPSFLVFPHRTAGLEWILSACLLYCLLPPARSAIRPILTGVALCSAILLALHWPPADPTIPASRFPETAPAAAIEPEHSAILETIKQEEEILEELKTIEIRIQSVAARMKTASPTERKALEKESDKYLAEVERLQRLFEKISSAPHGSSD